jgi:hypothetical protein
MSGAADEEPAQTAVVATLGAPAAMRLGIVQPTSGSPLPAVVDPGGRSHSPPGRAPLRI